jgi:DNA-binding CsgD family transcriptional regulator
MGQRDEAVWEAAAWELHDGLERSLLAIALQLEQLGDSDDIDHIKGRLVALRSVVEESLREVQGLYSLIEPDLSCRAGLRIALESLLASQGITRDNCLSVTGDDTRLSDIGCQLLYKSAAIILSEPCSTWSFQVTIKQAHALLQASTPDMNAADNAMQQLSENFQAKINVASGELWRKDQGRQVATINILVPLGENVNSGSPPELSEREHQVLLGLIHGLTMKQIGEKLYLSKSTVETYKRRLFEKLGFSKKSDLIAYAIKNRMFIEGHGG